MSVALLKGVVLALVGFNPIHFMFVANVLQGILAPVLILLILILGNSRKVMRSYRFGIPTTICLALAAATTIANIALLWLADKPGRNERNGWKGCNGPEPLTRRLLLLLTSQTL